MYHLGQDLGGNWMWSSYLIKHGHNGRSCDLGIFGISEVNSSARAFKHPILRYPRGPRDKSSGFCQIPICVFFSELLMHSLINQTVRPWLFGVRTRNQIIFIGFQNFLVHASLGLRYFTGWNISPSVYPSIPGFAGFQYLFFCDFLRISLFPKSGN